MKYKIALCQLLPSTDKDESMRRFAEMAKEAKENGAEVLAFPEMWPCPYVTEYIDVTKEPEGGKLYQFMSDTAKELGVYIVGGSMPEEDEGKLYNTSFIFNRQGELIGKHRKAHMFDIDVPGGITFFESDFITPGEKATVVDTEFGKIGVAICFDIRFAELFRKMSLEGAQAVILPSVFNLTTGPAHWELTTRMRAVDNQIFFAGIQAARDPDLDFKAWGHSIAVDPWGEVLASADENPQIIYAEVDTDRVTEVRQQLPIISGLRPELY